MLDQLVAEGLFSVGGFGAELGDAVDDVADKVETVEIVHDRHVERRGRRALLLVAADVQILWFVRR